MTANYLPDSPYANTSFKGDYLDILNYRTIPAEIDDAVHTLTQVHKYRPDLLAYDLYGNANLWWVFAQRNPNVIKDPIWDFDEGLRFFIPKKSNIEQALGL
jgi:hypothetical protein